MLEVIPAEVVTRTLPKDAPLDLEVWLQAPDRELTDKIFAEGMKGDLVARGTRIGLVLDVGGYYKNVFTLAPSFEITEEEIDLGVELLDQLIRRCASGRV